MDNGKIKMNIEMEVTLEQAIVLREMFYHLNTIGNDKDGRVAIEYQQGFFPKCQVTTDKPLPDLIDDTIIFDEVKDCSWVFGYDSLERQVHDFQLGIEDCPFKV